jgi:hypothetical protein
MIPYKIFPDDLNIDDFFDKNNIEFFVKYDRATRDWYYVVNCEVEELTLLKLHFPEVVIIKT